ncbi:hypothetical protein [Nocardioides sp.]|uniref:hypothetical protein n=1 Tax=Nocardioides sp. TaxID=35761 RepID=UPI0035164B8C
MSATSSGPAAGPHQRRWRAGVLLLVAALAIGLAAHLWRTCCPEDAAAPTGATTSMTSMTAAGHHAAASAEEGTTTRSAASAGSGEAHGHGGLALLCGALLAVAALGVAVLLLRARAERWWLRLPRAGAVLRRPPGACLRRPPPGIPLVMRC